MGRRSTHIDLSNNQVTRVLGIPPEPAPPSLLTAAAKWALIAAGSIAALIGLLNIPGPPSAEQITAIDAMANSNYIACSGDIGSAVNTALAAEEQVLIGPGECTSSVQWDHQDGSVIMGLGPGVTEVTFTNTSGCATAGPTSDSSAVLISDLTFIMQNAAVDGICMFGLSNTGMISRIQTEGGNDHIVLAAATSDNSAAWVGTVADWVSVDAGQHALVCCNNGGTSGWMRLQLVRTIINNPGDSALRINQAAHYSSNLTLIDTEIDTTQPVVVEVTSSNITPVTFIGGATDIGTDQTFLSSDSATPLTVIDHAIPSGCDFIADRSTTDVACTTPEQQVLPANGSLTASNMDEDDRAIWADWQEMFHRGITRETAWWELSDTDTATHVQCSGGVDIGPTVATALAAGDDIYLYNDGGTGSGTDGHCISSEEWVVGDGQKIIGLSNDAPNAGSVAGVWVKFQAPDMPGTCGIDATGNVEISRFKVGVEGTGATSVDTICLTGFTGILSQLDTRNSRNHVVLLPDGDNMVSDGGVIRQLLNFSVGGCTIFVDGADSKTNLTLIGMDIGREAFDTVCLDDMDGPTSAVAVLGHQFHVAGQPLIFDINSSEETPFLWVGASPNNFVSTTDFVVADSQSPATVIVMETTNPAVPVTCDLLVDRPTGDVSCTASPTANIDLVGFTP